MLISPLMGVITSFSYGIVIRNSKWIQKSLMQFGFQIGICILTSTLYFFLTPLRSFSGELLARTQPTLWDALIAIFGGIAAIIANTRKSSFSNVIPGAAIATALMPPLCTVGYCMATGRWVAALSALYLFSINVAFIAISGVIGLKLMHISNNEVLSKQNRNAFVFILILALLPSAWIAIQSVKQVSLDDRFHQFIQQEFQFKNAQVVKSELLPKEKHIRVALIGSVVPEERIQELESKLVDYDLDAYDLLVSQTQVEQ